MRNFDETGLKLCRMQAKLFVLSASKLECSSPIFLRRFMLSEVASRMDRGGFLCESCTGEQLLQEIEDEFGSTNYGKEKYGTEELYWMGYLYRYWCYTYEKSSKQVYRQIKPKKLRLLYYPYHSLDPSKAIERILESENLAEEDLIQKGVEILRRISAEKKQDKW